MTTCLGRLTARAFRKLLTIYVFSFFPFGFEGGYGIWLYQFLLIGYLFTFQLWRAHNFLAHLSRRLTRWAYRMGLEPASVRPCVRASVRASTLSNMNISETGRRIAFKFYMKHHWGGGKAALGFGADQIRTLVSMATDSSHKVIMGKKGVITFSRLFLIGSFLYLQVTMTYIRACMSSKFGRMRPRTTELAALERQKKFS